MTVAIAVRAVAPMHGAEIERIELSKRERFAIGELGLILFGGRL